MSQQDALWFALGANRENGQRMTSADKKHAILMALTTWPEKSQRAIAEQIGCSDVYISQVKKTHVQSTSHLPDRVLGKDGKSYPATRQTIGCEHGGLVSMVPRPSIELLTRKFSDTRVMWWRRGESNRGPLTWTDTLRPNASPVSEIRHEARCPYCGEDRLVDWCPVLCRWECAVCAKSWRLDARLPHDDDQTPLAASEIRGRLYNRLKKQGARTDITSAQNEQKSEAPVDTAQRIADQQGVSRATVVRDGQFAEAVPDIQERVLRGDVPSKAELLPPCYPNKKAGWGPACKCLI
jgi:hypothetical protein